MRTVADHWAELTMVHPFQDGNSRTQRFFFDQMLRNAGWSVDWTRINAERAHAARYVGAATVDPSFLAQTLLPGVRDGTGADTDTESEAGTNTTAADDGLRDDRPAAAIFHDMMTWRRAHPGQPYEFRPAPAPGA
ncbi:Fic family protein [Corynebacteriaceae bacterium 7-707]